jgi:tetratricopeptide (TPR) repeat protein
VSALLVAMALPMRVMAQSSVGGGCGGLENAYGPFDYSDPLDKADKLNIVERYHFTAQVENLVAGQSGALVMDIDYTLRAFPNHARALWAMARYQMAMGRAWSPSDHFYSMDCYFDRAERWRPGDATVWMIHGMYLAKQGRNRDAVEQYERALALQSDSPEINYNAGLNFVELKQFDRARETANKAYSQGYPLPGLRNMLKRAGEWQEVGATNSRAAEAKK